MSSHLNYDRNYLNIIDKTNLLNLNPNSNHHHQIHATTAHNGLVKNFENQHDLDGSRQQLIKFKNDFASFNNFSENKNCK
jgi:hypothetical protein